MTSSTGQKVRAGTLVALLIGSVVLSGCLDTLFPQREEEREVREEGLLRIWAATSRGGVSNEFVHYNVSFGGVAHATDLLLNELRPMEMRNHQVDLVHMERERKAIELARAWIPDGEYFGFGFYNSEAVLGVERVVGTDAQGRAVTKIEEHHIDYSSNVITPRAAHAVVGGRVTDLYLEIDLQRSLQRGDSGMLRHTTIPAGVAVFVDGIKVAWRPLDGGLSQMRDDDPRRENPRAGRENPSAPPDVDLQIRDVETDARHYWSLTSPLKRMARAAGIGEDLLFDGSKSMSNIIQADYQRATAYHLPIIEYKWDFGDGETMTGRSVTKNYTKGGLYDVTLTVRDSEHNVGRDHATLFVPYRADEAVVSRTQTLDGNLFLGNQGLGFNTDMDRRTHSFEFPLDLEDGKLTLGGYSVRVVTNDPQGGNLFGLQETRVEARSGHFRAQDTDHLPLELESAGIPVWRGPLKPWVTTGIDVEVQLMTGLLAEYEIVVDAHYYHNLSRGLDPHPQHIHGSWPFGPHWEHLDWDGSVKREE